MINFHNTDNMKFMADVPDKYYDLAIVDPPYFKGVAKENFYGLNRKVKKKKASAHWDENIPTKEYYNELLRISKHQIIWGINYFDFGFVGGGRLIWDKKNDTSTFSKAEIASCSLINSVQIFRWLWNGMLQEDMKNKWHSEHPSPKPPQLYEWLLSKYAKPNDKIIDTHGGSGSIAIAVDKANTLDNTNYSLDICELDKDYFDASVNRFNKYKSQQTIQFK
jgi:site-specific DNA-methyltransferase (adenine-specific)